MKMIVLMMLLVGTAGSVLAGVPSTVPEIDSASVLEALALLSGGLLVIRGRRKK